MPSFGLFAYINAAGNLIIGDDTYEVSTTTILRNEDGTVIAVGRSAINTALATGDQVKDVVVENGVVVSMVGTAVASETAAAQPVIDDIAALTFADATAPTAAEITAVEDARADYEALTNSQKDLVTNLDDLVTAEATIVGATDQQAAQAVIDDITALTFADATAPTAAEITAVEDARADYEALTAVQKDLVTNLDDLVAAELVVDTAAAVDAVNNAGTPLTMRNALETNADLLDIDVTDARYVDNKDTVANELIGGAFADAAAVKAAFEAALDLL